MQLLEGISSDPWTLTGREAERHVIVERLSEGAPHCIVITGDPGVGRTRLAREALVAARDAGWSTLSATGTTAASAVPLGAMAHLIPPAEPALDPLALLQRAMSTIVTAGGERPLVLVVDDAHLLDDLSQTLVQQLATGGIVSVVITIRTATAPGLAALCRDGTAERIDLAPLERDQSDRLVAAALGGDVDTRSCERLRRLTRGNPMYLRELVEGGLAAGHLRRRDGCWRWAGEMSPSPRLVEIVDAQLDVNVAERAALEVLAVGEQVSLETLLGMSTTATVAGLERIGLAAVEGTGQQAQVRMTHPLHAEVVRAQMPEAAAIRIRQQLANGGARSRSKEELLRAGRMALDGAGPALDAALLTEAAGCANENLDHPLAERLARAAVDAGGGIAARLALLESVQWQGRSMDAEAIARAAATWALSDDERARLAVMRALNAFCGAGRASDAEARLRETAAVVPGLRARDELIAALALIAFLRGRAEEAVDLGTGVLARLENRTFARSLAAAATAGALAMTGRTKEALAVAATGWSEVQGAPTESQAAFVRLSLAQGELLALWLSGRFADLHSRAVELHEQSMTAPDWAGDAVAALHIGWAALAPGHVSVAKRWLTEAMAGFRRQDPMGLLPVCASQLAQTRSLLGDDSGAREALGQVDAVRDRAMPAFEPLILLGRAWVTAATDRREGLDIALEAARLAADLGLWAIEATVLQAVVQLGRPGDVAGRLRQLAAQLDNTLVSIYADHADAAAEESGGRLDSVVAEYERVGAYLAAEDASAVAAAAHRRARHHRRASAAAVKAAKLARSCGRPRTPGLVQLSMPHLTSREEEVARHASAGRGNAEIAARLVLSVRTVEAHLANVYAKLGITSRTQLRDALAATAAPDGNR